MEKGTAQIILKAITEKGWNLYYRGTPDKKCGLAETFRREPVDSLEQGILYVILPRVNNPAEQNKIDTFIKRHQVQPKIIISPGFSYLGRGVAKFSGGDETKYSLQPEEEVYFIGFELWEEEIKLLAHTETFMPYDVFLSSLNSLQNITELERVPV